MRIALITIAADQQRGLRVAGQPIAWHQLGSALGAGCERVICLTDHPAPQLSLLQREAERRGASFQAISPYRSLSGLVSAADTLLVFAPWVLTDREWLAQEFGARAGIAVLSADGAVDRGYERIDRQRAWAGVLSTRGDAIEALAALPPDADAASGLLRIALQRGTPAVLVPANLLDERRWSAIVTPADVEDYQRGWYARHVPPPPPLQVFRTLAHRAARGLAERVQVVHHAALKFGGAGAALATLGAIGGYRGYSAGGLAALTGASALLEIGTELTRLADAGSSGPVRDRIGDRARALVDIALIVLAASQVAFGSWFTAFTALVLCAVMRLADQRGAPPALLPFADRTAVLALLTIAAAGGAFAPVAALLCLAGLAVQLFWPRPRLTQA